MNAPEREIVLDLARAAGDESFDGSGFPRSADWDAVIASVDRHGLVPHLRRYTDLLPDSAHADRVVERARVVAASAVLQEMCNRELLARAEAEGVRLLFIKGQVLSVEAYGEIGLRQTSDIDVVVDPDQLSRFADVLSSAGFVRQGGGDDRSWERVMRLASSWNFVRRDVVVDVHWRLYTERSGRAPSVASLLDSRRLVSMGECEVPVLSEADQIVYLAVHGAKHLWGRLEWLCCFHLLARRESVDWGRVWDIADEIGAGRRIAVGLQLAERVIGGTTYHPMTWRRVPGSIIDSIVARWFEEGARSSFARAVLESRLRERRADVAGLWWEALTHPNFEDLTFVDLPPRLDWMYRVLRPIRLLRDRLNRQKSAGPKR